MIYLTASDLFKFSGKHRSGAWQLGDSIIRDGWDDRFPLTLRLREGATTVLPDGNRRVSYLVRNGSGAIPIPVRIEVE